MDIKKKYERWLANATADADVAVELKTLDDTKIEDAFYRDLAFAKLKTICQNKNITQYALAKATGMSTSSISCLMRGETKPYIYTVLTICDALNVTIADLLERQGYDENCEEDEDVREMIEAYQCLSPEKKRMLKVYMDMLLQYGGEL